MITGKILDKYQDEFEKKRQELELNHSNTGSARTYSSMRKYDDLIQIIRIARRQLDGSCGSCERHERSIDSSIKKYTSYQEADIKDFENYSDFISELKSLRL